MIKTTAIRGAVTALALGLGLAGCSTPVPLATSSNVPVETRSGTPVGAGGGGGAGQGAAESKVATVGLDARNDGAVAAPRIVYFDYDSFVIKDEFRGVIDASAKRLAANRNQRLMIEGHTDERGGREYNLALGQKRAEAVAKALALLGASEAQMEAVSFGEERPAVQGSDEAAWAKNRRAEIKDK
ncbi:MAG TPA: peptidoglycan-associated lipoprotein Pal [Burkholderiaceae bacterium]|nr:peptidoglycan-associated lipoprotein Pal [Burkholderiaceae bacterium]